MSQPVPVREAMTSDPWMQHQTQDKHILIGGSPPFFEAVNDLIAYGLFNCHGTVSLVQISKGEQNMVQASVVGLGNIVGDGERLQFLSVFCVAYLEFLMLTDAVYPRS